jgi:predicted nucleotidyltransferase
MRCYDDRIVEQPMNTIIDAFLNKVVEWAQLQPEVAAVALVGSHTRGTAREDSDIDLVLLTKMPRTFLMNTDWLLTFGEPIRQETEDWGKVTSIRVCYAEGYEVEFGVAGMDWASDPSDEGDARVVKDGIRILYERAGALSNRLARFVV